MVPSGSRRSSSKIVRPCWCWICAATKHDDLLEQVKAEWPDVLIVALGVPGRNRCAMPSRLGIYAAEDVDLERRPFQALIGRALDIYGSWRTIGFCERNVQRVEERRYHANCGEVKTQVAGATLRLLRFPRVFRRCGILGYVVEQRGREPGRRRNGQAGRDFFPPPGRRDVPFIGWAAVSSRNSRA